MAGAHGPTIDRGRQAPELTPGELARAIVEFSRYLRVGEGDLVGQPLELLPFQLDFIARAFPADRRIRRAILSLARKNGKTALVAVIVLAALMGPLARPYGEVISAARSKEQAGQVFRYARKILEVSRLLHRVIVRESKMEIEDTLTGVVYHATSADARRNHGSAPFLVIHDELGQVRGPHDALYDTLSTSLGAYAEALEIVIGTQAATDADLLSLLIDDALRGGDPGTVCVLHTAPPEADPFVEETWRMANPALGVFRSLEDVRGLADQARRIPAKEASFRNLVLNQRIDANAHWLSAPVWAINQRPCDVSLFEDGRLVYGGLDLSLRTDLSALVLVCQDDAGDVHVLPRFWTPGATLKDRALRDRAPFELWAKQGYLTVCQGNYVSYSEIADYLLEVGRRYRVQAINFDRWRMRELLRELERAGERSDGIPFTPRRDADEGFEELVHCAQSFRDMTPALEAAEELALDGRLRCGGNPVLAWNVSAAAVTWDAAGGRKLDKRQHNGRIDGAVALVMACKALRVDALEGGGISSGSSAIFV